VDEETEVLEPDHLWETAKEAEPDIVLAGFSAYPREIPFEVFADIAEEHDAYFVVDIAHIAGLIAKDEHPSPFPQADVVTTTTHKTLRGARGGMILTNNEELADEIDSKIFPGIQGGPLMHIIAAKAVSFREALQPEFKEYQQQIKRNAVALGEELDELGYHIVSGGTDTHLLLVNLKPKGLTGKEAEEALDEVSITTNKNTVPGETESPFVTSGIRLGTSALTTRGMEEDAMKEVAGLIDRVLSNLDHDNINQIKDEVQENVRNLTDSYPLYPFIRDEGLASARA
jgi:glycine hydroxymethyltransferase